MTTYPFLIRKWCAGSVFLADTELGPGNERLVRRGPEKEFERNAGSPGIIEKMREF